MNFASLQWMIIEIKSHNIYTVMTILNLQFVAGRSYTVCTRKLL